MPDYVRIYHREGGSLFLKYDAREFYMDPFVTVKPIPSVIFYYNNPSTGTLEESIAVFLRKNDYTLVRITELPAIQSGKVLATTSAMDDAVLTLDDIAKAFFLEIENMPRKSAATFIQPTPNIVS